MNIEKEKKKLQRKIDKIQAKIAAFEEKYPELASKPKDELLAMVKEKSVQLDTKMRVEDSWLKARKANLDENSNKNLIEAIDHTLAANKKLRKSLAKTHKRAEDYEKKMNKNKI